MWVRGACERCPHNNSARADRTTAQADSTARWGLLWQAFGAPGSIGRKRRRSTGKLINLQGGEWVWCVHGMLTGVHSTYRVAATGLGLSARADRGGDTCDNKLW